MMRVFLDANVLFSAAYREQNGILVLWDRKDLRLVTSSYALMEAERNITLKRPEAASRFLLLAGGLEVSPANYVLAQDHGLPDKDRPILAAAAGSTCAFLLTGDMAHFGHLIGQTAEGVQVITVSLFLATYPHRE